MIDTHVLVVCHWYSKLETNYVKAQVTGAYVGIGNFAIDVDISIDNVDGR